MPVCGDFLEGSGTFLGLVNFELSLDLLGDLEDERPLVFLIDAANIEDDNVDCPLWDLELEEGLGDEGEGRIFLGLVEVLSPENKENNNKLNFKLKLQ